MSPRTIRRWTRALIWTMVAGIGIGALIALVGVLVGDDTLPDLGLGVGALAVLLTLLIAAYVGGQTLARFGGLVGLALIAGIVLGLTGDSIAPWVMWLGIALAVLAVAGFFVMGLRRRVPIWIGGIVVAGRPDGERRARGSR